MSEHSNIASRPEAAGDPPKVSVIMPAYEVAEYIGEAVGSVFAQTVSDFELVVVNDCSPDTEALEAALAPYFDRIVYVKLPENRGVSAARNAALAVSRGRFIALLDPDDVWEPNYLEVQLGILEKDPTISVLYPDARIFGNSRDAGRTFMDVFPSEGEVTVERLLQLKCTVMVSVTARRAAIIDAGMFDEELRRCEDFDLWLRILHAGGRIAFHRAQLVHYRRRVGGLTSDSDKMCRSAITVLDKMAATMTLSDAEREAWTYRRSRYYAYARMMEGKRALFAGEIAEAITCFEEANTYLNRWKLTLVVRVSRIAPGFLLWAYRARVRGMFNEETRV